MLDFHKFTLQGTIPHRDTKITFNKGVNIIRGANFSGKSSIFLLMGQLVTGELPNTPKREKDNVGRLSLSWSKEGKYCEAAYDLGKGRITSIIEDGQEIHYKGKDEYTAKLDEMLPFTLDSWQNSTYISSHTFPYLLYGTSLQRKQLFEALFDIDTDRQYKFFRKLDAHMEKVETERETLRGLEVEHVYKSDLTKLESRIKKLRTELENAEKRLKVSGKYLEAKETWGRYSATFGKTFGTLSKEELKKRLQKIDPSKLYDELEAAKDHEDLVESWTKREAAEIAFDVAQKAYKSFKNPDDIVPPSTAYMLLDVLEEYYAVFECYQNAPPPVAADETSLLNERDKLERRIRAIEHASECPLCSTKLESAAKKKLLLTLRKELETLKAQIDESEIAFQLGAEQLLHRLGSEGVSWKDAQKWRNNQQKLLAFADLEDKAHRLLKIPKVKLPKTKPRAVDVIEDDIHNCKREAKAIEAYLAFTDACLDACFNGKGDDNLEGDVKELRDKLRTLEDVYSEKRVEHRKFVEIQRKISRCNHTLKIRPAIKTIKTLYSPKGLRAVRVRDKVEQYIDNLNAEAKDIFPNYRFFVESDDESGVNIKCERPAGTSPIRRLSGAEGAIFPLLSLLALHPLLPEEKLTNLLVLDEPEKGMRSDTRKLFVNEIVPRLAQAYSSLWIVTPMLAEEYPIYVPDCKMFEYETYAENGVSTLLSL